MMSLALLVSSVTYAQVSLFSDSLSMRKGKKPAYILEIDEVDYKKTKSKWVKAITEQNKAKADINNLDIEVQDAQITDIIKDSLNIYSRVLEKENQVVIESFYELPNGFASKNDKENLEGIVIAKFLNNFASEVFNNHLSTELKKMKDEQKKLTKELKKSEALIVKLEKKINNNLASNESMAQENLGFDNKMEQSSESITKQNQLISSLTPGSEAMKTAEKQLSDFEKGKKKTKKAKDKNIKRIQRNLKNNSDMNTNIERTKSSIVNLKKQMEEKKQKIEETQKRML